MNCNLAFSAKHQRQCVVETIDYYLRNGSEVFTCIMDMSKAFDKVQHSKLFWKIIDKGIPTMYIRLLHVMYCNQRANVSWNSHVSHVFPINNGVKQGAALSPILYCVYIDDLFEALRRGKWILGEQLLCRNCRLCRWLAPISTKH